MLSSSSLIFFKKYKLKKCFEQVIQSSGLKFKSCKRGYVHSKKSPTQFPSLEATNVTSFLCIIPERKCINKKLTLAFKIILSLLHRLSGLGEERGLIITLGVDYQGGQHIYLQGYIHFLRSFSEKEMNLNVFLSHFRSK